MTTNTTPRAVTVHGHTLTPGTRLHHDHLGPTIITAITKARGHTRIELEAQDTASQTWLTYTLQSVRNAWGRTLTPTHTSTPPTSSVAVERTRNQPRAYGERVVDDTHDCIPETEQTTDTERCRLCGQLIQ